MTPNRAASTLVACMTRSFFTPRGNPSASITSTRPTTRKALIISTSTSSQIRRRYRSSDITGPGGAAKGNPHYEFLGVTRYWCLREKMEQLYREGRIPQTKPGTVPAQKRYLDEGKGTPIGTLWDHIGLIQAAAVESLGYPTQKPLALLDRIVRLSSNPNDIVLDAFLRLRHGAGGGGTPRKTVDRH